MWSVCFSFDSWQIYFYHVTVCLLFTSLVDFCAFSFYSLFPVVVAFPFSRGSSYRRDQTRVSCIAGRFFTIWATREDPKHSHSSWKSRLIISPLLPNNTGILELLNTNHSSHLLHVSDNSFSYFLLSVLVVIFILALLV